jgi:hypothetical protein
MEDICGMYLSVWVVFEGWVVLVFVLVHIRILWTYCVEENIASRQAVQRARPAVKQCREGDKTITCLRVRLTARVLADVRCTVLEQFPEGLLENGAKAGFAGFGEPPPPLAHL